MIEVTISTEGEKLSLRLKGHAGYAEMGKDIVCSSAAILAYTLAQFVYEAGAKGVMKMTQVRLDAGDTEISCQPQYYDYEETKKMYQFAKMGYSILAQNYPQYVRLRS